MVSSQDADKTLRVIVTGANGLIGSLLLRAWRQSGAYDGIGIARQTGETTDLVIDLTELEPLVDAFRGADAIVHLGASSAIGSTWEQVLPSNLIATYNVYEAARRAGVPHVVFASSNHAIGTYETQNAPELYALDDGRVWDHTAEIRPDSLYGVSKVYGEALGRYYVDHHGLRVQCLRIGGVRSPEDPSHPANLWASEHDHDEDVQRLRTRTRAVWQSERDCIQLIERCLDSNEPWVLAYGISNNPRRFWDIEHAREVLGYEPLDSPPAEIVPDRS